MAIQYATRCRCGYSSDETIGFLESDFAKPRPMQRPIRVQRPAPPVHWDEMKKLGEVPEDGFEKELIESYSYYKHFTNSEKIFAWIYNRRRRTKPLYFSKDPWWFLTNRVARFARWTGLDELLVPYSLRTKCPRCGRMTLLWRETALLD